MCCLVTDQHLQPSLLCSTTSQSYLSTETTKLNLAESQPTQLFCFLLSVFQGLQGGWTSPDREGRQPSFREPTSSPTALPGEDYGKILLFFFSFLNRIKLRPSDIQTRRHLSFVFTEFKIALCKNDAFLCKIASLLQAALDQQ